MVSPLRTFFDFVNFPNRFLLLMFTLIVSSLLSKIVFQQSQPLGSFILIWKAWDDDKIIKIEYCGCAEWLWTCGIHIMIDDQIFPKVVLCSVGCKVKAHWGKIQDAKVLPTTYSIFRAIFIRQDHYRFWPARDNHTDTACKNEGVTE